MSRRRFGHAFALLLAVLLATASPAAWAVLCSSVFYSGPAGDGLNAYVPLPSIPSFDSSSSPVLTAANPRAVPVSNSYWKGGTSPTSWRLTTPGSGTARVYVDGDLYIDNNSEINRYGSPSNLIIVVKGNLTIANSNNTYVNAMIYVTGNAVIGNNPKIRGAISAQGSMSKGNNIVYDPSAIAGTDFGTLCDNPDSVGQIDHFRFLYASSGLSCAPLDVQLQACATSSCDRLYEGSISVTLSPSTWAGGTLVAFNGGQVALKLSGTGAVTLGIAAATPAANNPLTCSTSGCVVNFAAAGLLVQAPDLIAGKPDTLTVTAAAGCVAAFANVSRSVQFWSTYLDPDAATQVGSRAVLLGGGAISGSAASPTSLTLNFNASGQATTSLSYADAGQVQIDARYVGSAATGDSGSSMSGADPFVSRPYGLHLSTDASCSAASVAGCTVLRAAGDSFPLRIRAVAWQADGEARTAAALADNPSTPNFRLAGIALSSSVAAPSGGDNGSLSPASYSHALGTQTTVNPSQAEVGVFTISATPPANGYFGYTVDGGTSDLVGRFTPAWLNASAVAQLTPSCGAFSYQQQEIGFVGGLGPLLTVTGYNRQGAVTKNYDRGEFWRLAAPQRQDYLSISGRTGLDAAGRLQSLGDAQSSALSGDLAGDGARQFRWASDRLRWSAALVAQADDLPFGVAGATIARLRLAAGQLTDADGVCYASSGCSAFSFDFGGSEVRLGRLRFGNAFGSELQGLDVPFWLESWQALGGGLNGFRSESADTCSAPLLGTPALQAVAGSLQPTDFASPSVVAPVAGQGAVRLPAPGKEGSVSVGLSGLEGASPALPWLLYDANGDALREAARGLASFGVYRGSAPLIFRRELYR